MKRWVAASVIVTAAVVGVLGVRTFVSIPFLDAGATAIHDASTLRARIHVCGRTYGRGATDRSHTMAEIASGSGGSPTLADPRLLAPCPSGACAVTAGGPCATVVFVRVGDDEFVAYSLAGGP